MQCGVGTSYKSSMTTCALETCASHTSRISKDMACIAEPLVEGCAPEPCPYGQVYQNESSFNCMRSIECREECKYLDGVQYYEGDIIEEGLNYTWYSLQGHQFLVH